MPAERSSGVRDPVRAREVGPGPTAAGRTGPGDTALSRLLAHPLVPYLAVLALLLAGLGVVSRGGWRWGLGIVAAGLVLAAVLRLALPARRAGLLLVRSRSLDALFLLCLAVVLVLFTAVDPASRG